eukprot:c20046_g1_i2.p1 GENE.c20046_g1_i2~~c20046_g1_i2.p1  ORF type:complete len:936 (+),score=165.23 c20046_g1_i2:165-2810(+)
MFLIVVASVLSIILQSLPELSSVNPLVWKMVDVFCGATFTLELAIRFGMSPFKRRFFMDWLNWIDIVSILTFYLAMAFDTCSTCLIGMRSVKSLRISRVLILGRYSHELWVVFQTFRKNLTILLLLGAISFILALLFATLVYIFEHNAQPNVFSNITESMWWAVVTLTTVGFGDMQPVTVAGQICGGILMLLGTVMIRLPMSILCVSCIRIYAAERRRKAHRPLSLHTSRFSLAAILETKTVQRPMSKQRQTNGTGAQMYAENYQRTAAEMCDETTTATSQRSTAFQNVRRRVWRAWEHPRESSIGLCYAVVLWGSISSGTAAVMLKSASIGKPETIDNITWFANSFMLCDLTLRIFFAESLKQMVYDWQNVVQTIALVPFLIARLTHLRLPSISVLAALRLIRLCRLSNRDLSRKITLLRVAVVQSLSTLTMLLLAVSLTLTIGGFFAYSFEGDAFSRKTEKSDDSGKYENMFEYLYWASQTITTVGYGDIVLHTTGSKIIGAILAIAGGISIALPASILGDAFTSNLEHSGGVEGMQKPSENVDVAALNSRLIEFHRDLLGFHATLQNKYPDLINSNLVADFKLLNSRSVRSLLSPKADSDRTFSLNRSSSPVMTYTRSMLRKMLTEDYNLTIKRASFNVSMSRTALHLHRLLGGERHEGIANYRKSRSSDLSRNSVRLRNNSNIQNSGRRSVRLMEGKEIVRIDEGQSSRAFQEAPGEEHENGLSEAGLTITITSARFVVPTATVIWVGNVDDEYDATESAAGAHPLLDSQTQSEPVVKSEHALVEVNLLMRHEKINQTELQNAIFALGDDDSTITPETSLELSETNSTAVSTSSSLQRDLGEQSVQVLHIGDRNRRKSTTALRRRTMRQEKREHSFG